MTERKTLSAKSPAGDGFEEINVLRKDKPDAVFEGKLVADVSSKNYPGAHGGGGQHWTELAVYELRNGDWVACSFACTDKAGQVDYGDFAKIKRAPVVAAEEPEQVPVNGVVAIREMTMAQAVEETKDRDRDADSPKREAMKFFGWSWLAKELAEKAGWDVRERIG